MTNIQLIIWQYPTQKTDGPPVSGVTPAPPAPIPAPAPAAAAAPPAIAWPAATPATPPAKNPCCYLLFRTDTVLERADHINAPPKATPVWSRPSSVNGDPQVAAVVGSPIQLVHCVLTSTAQPSLLNKAQGLQLTAILGLESLHQLKAIGPLAFKGYPTLGFFSWNWPRWPPADLITVNLLSDWWYTGYKWSLYRHRRYDWMRKKI